MRRVRRSDHRRLVLLQPLRSGSKPSQDHVKTASSSGRPTPTPELSSDLIDGMSRREYRHYFRLLICMAGAALSAAYLTTLFAVLASLLFTFGAWVFGFCWCATDDDDIDLLKTLSAHHRALAREDELVPLNHVLYRLYNNIGELLYVGITSDVVTRMAGHRADKRWWSEVADKKFEYFYTRAELEAVERLAIIREKPRYNIIHQPNRPQSTAQRTRPRKPTPTGKR